MTEGIALVGMSGRFPGAATVHEFWENVKAGRDTISHFEADELEASPVVDERGGEATPIHVRARGILDDVDRFDARFFGCLPREAEIMDPQHRLFLECAWEALEGAGYDAERYPGSIGVYGGCFFNTYLLHNLATAPGFVHRVVESVQVGSLQPELGNDSNYLATRVGYKLNLRGPCVTVGTACSTSLVAVAHACQSLMTYQSDMVLAGGATVVLPQKKGYYYKEGGMVSPDGHCRTFSDEAQGTVFSNGVGVVLLKRLSDAVEDRDTIYAVIRGWGLNNDGSTGKLSFTAPSVEGQSEAIAQAHALAGVDADTVSYVEAHGTGTPLGDPIEVESLTRAFRRTTDMNGFCALGSVKTNIGHLDAASGVVGLIKTTLQLHHETLPPTAHFQRPNPRIDFENTPFYVNTELREWPRGDTPRRAGLNSFGIGGTNAHVVLEEAPPVRRESKTTPEGFFLLPLSARTETALGATTGRLADHMETARDLRVDDVARTLQLGRAQFEHRRFVVARDVSSAIEALKGEALPGTSGRTRAADVPVTFMFPGQGAQHPNMAAGLYRSEADFRKSLDTCLDHLDALVDFDPRALLFPPGGQEEAAAESLKQTSVAQPVIFAVEYALARWWMGRGVHPARLVGHSIGEFTAAALAGVFQLPDALEVVVERGRLMQAQPPGDMIAVRAASDAVERLLTASLELAAVNAPTLCVVSGPAEAVTTFAETLDHEGIAWSLLKTSHAFHSQMMEPAMAPLAEVLSRMELSPPQIPIVSTSTGEPLADEEAVDPDYWSRQLRRPVRFAAAVRCVAEEGGTAFLEVGPGRTLSTLTRQILGKDDASAPVPSLGPVQAPGDDREKAAEALGRLWLLGVDVDWERVAPPTGWRIPLPTYPFERKRFWVEATPRQVETEAESSGDSIPADAPSTEGSGETPTAVSGDPQASRRGSREVERILERQIQIMREQLRTLSGS